MNLQEWLSESGVSQFSFAKSIGVHQSMISQWVCGTRPIPVERMADIERLTEGKVSRRDLHSDWARIWPELSRMGAAA